MHAHAAKNVLLKQPKFGYLMHAVANATDVQNLAIVNDSVAAETILSIQPEGWFDATQHMEKFSVNMCRMYFSKYK